MKHPASSRPAKLALPPSVAKPDGEHINATSSAAIVEERERNLVLASHRAVRAGDWGEALNTADEALQFNPGKPESLFLAGFALLRMDQKGVALVLLNAASQLEPDRPEIWNALGYCLIDQHREKAHNAFLKAHRLQPENPVTMSNLCCSAMDLGRLDEALSWGEKALALDPTDQMVIQNTALALVGLGRWREGWARYASSLGNKNREVRNYHATRVTPRWAPGMKPDCKVVIYGEQGIGDEILYASMLNNFAGRPEKIILECDWRLEGLFRRSFPWATVYGTRGLTQTRWPIEEKPDAKLEIGALGEFFAPEPFRSSGYLKADPMRRAMVRAWLDASAPSAADARGGGRDRPLRVGFAWTGGAWATDRAARSIPRAAAEIILKVPGIEFVCLEYETPPTLPAGMRDLRDFVGKGVDYDLTAAVVAELDLVIAPSTSIVDLAGALGVPCWAIVNTSPPFRYSGKAGDDEMWFYSSVKAYRQRIKGQWAAPCAAVARDLRAMVEARA